MTKDNQNDEINIIEIDEGAPRESSREGSSRDRSERRAVMSSGGGTGRRRGHCVFACILLGALVLVGASVGITYFVMSNNQPAEEEPVVETVTQVVVTEDGKEVEMTKFDVIAQLNGRLDAFENTGGMNHANYVMELYNGVLSKDGKVYFALTSLQGNGLTPISDAEMQDILDNDFTPELAAMFRNPDNGDMAVDNFDAVSVEALAERYHEVYGEDFSLDDFLASSQKLAGDIDILTVGGCGGFGYIASKKIFIDNFAIGCGGVVPEIDSYRYNYEVTGDKAYVDVAAGTSYWAGADCELVTIYHSVTSWNADLRKYEGDNPTCQNSSDYNIVRSWNYQDFAKYRFNFQRSGDSYYFTGVSRL